MFRNIILFPHRAGQKRLGVDKTPLLLKPLFHPNCNIIDTPVNNNLQTNLYNLYKKNFFINGTRVNIGGDHSMSIATVADSIRRYPSLKLIWMDAHADINTYDESITKNYHGMPLSILTGIEKKHSLKFIKTNLSLKNILYIGLRDIDLFEQKIITNNNMNVITIDDIQKNKDDYVLDRISDFTKNHPVHFSFDVDVLDPTVLPSTGTPVENGLQLETCKKIIDNIMTKNIVSVDLTELNLTIGHIEERVKSLIHFTYLFKNYIF